MIRDDMPPPMPLPLTAMPVAKPRRRTNHCDGRAYKSKVGQGAVGGGQREK